MRGLESGQNGPSALAAPAPQRVWCRHTPATLGCSWWDTHLQSPEGTCTPVAKWSIRPCYAGTVLDTETLVLEASRPHSVVALIHLA